MKNEIFLGCRCGWIAVADYPDAIAMFDLHNHDNTHHLIHVRMTRAKIEEREFAGFRREVFRLAQLERYREFQKHSSEQEMVDDDGLGCIRGCWSALKIMAGLVLTAAGIWFGCWMVGY